jgi:hypothetical protein
MANAQIEFYVSKGENQLGPWTVQEMASKLAAGEIAVTDFTFDDAQNDWVALFQCEAFQAYMKSQKPKSAPPKRATPASSKESSPVSSGTSVSAAQAPKNAPVDAPADIVTSQASEAAKPTSQEWFVQKGQHRYGPFSYLGVIRALQEKTVYEFDLCWKNGMNEWIRIAEHEDFQADKIRALTGETQSEEKVFAQRQHPRIGFETEVLVHDNRSVWLGRAFEGSVGGSGLVIENATLVPGQTVLLHFAENANLPAFNALCEIVGKKFAKDVRDPKSPVQYSVRFVKLDAQAEARVQKYFQSHSA